MPTRKSRFKAVSACVAVILLFRAYDVTRGADTAASFPPVLPAGAEVVTDTSDAFLKSPIKLADGVTVAKLPPTVEFRYFPGQTYPGAPWSAWGDSVVAGGKYYASIGDHLAIGKGDGAHGVGTGLVFEYDVER